MQQYGVQYLFLRRTFCPEFASCFIVERNKGILFLNLSKYENFSDVWYAWFINPVRWNMYFTYKPIFLGKSRMFNFLNDNLLLTKTDECNKLFMTKYLPACFLRTVTDHAYVITSIRSVLMFPLFLRNSFTILLCYVFRGFIQDVFSLLCRNYKNL